mmetsp:Transcript_34266/g.51675  ORF Transcript_34266/g.51675 Transcript_34266/m.51675 type:complete len:150 (-) Transcript_34266:372-821(-)|eukprot:CAMPEP_0206459804 /NCGR_PEP_ID=MMETSP0324_2-20121206/24388_1 /ASSEMBLY_ACC=CAM_ASM_000836 /TAXON_ID=2866 /ORGANISM="Crypthecodinium cohnii, Strain Seligo" /LENGTH=149 /DNA_ID=CAMNT_0053931413 /DNA_START=85 /DNA_END=534 /DNA_ORIENTATION=-
MRSGYTPSVSSSKTSCYSYEHKEGFTGHIPQSDRNLGKYGKSYCTAKDERLSQEVGLHHLERGHRPTSASSNRPIIQRGTWQTETDKLYPGNLMGGYPTRGHGGARSVASSYSSRTTARARTTSRGHHPPLLGIPRRRSGRPAPRGGEK